jgi:hypothetical protein
MGTEDLATPPPRPSTVIATRNFHKTSATLIDDITHHKHGSYFTQPVRDKEAAGYYDIIKQPQNLKSIRTAIAAGAKAVNNAAAASTESPSTTTGTPTKVTADSTTVELERTIDLIPPKGIVNSPQLEKEILRIFANAVMFNPGEDGMVQITREMFQDVEGLIGQWKGAENEGTATEVVEDEVRDKAKRRKL